MLCTCMLIIIIIKEVKSCSILPPLPTQPTAMTRSTDLQLEAMPSGSRTGNNNKNSNITEILIVLSQLQYTTAPLDLQLNCHHF